MTYRFLSAAIAMCEEAGAIQMAHLAREHQVDLKGRGNLVTEVDRLAEKAILESIRSQFPDHAIVAEESGEHGKGAEYVWYVDPLDGTTNYAHGFPIFAVSVGLVRNGQPIVGVVFAPALRELFTATWGGGTWLNGRPVRVSTAPNLEQSLVATGFYPPVQDLHNVDEFVHMLQNSQAVRRPGAASMDLAYVACGRFDGYWEYRLAPWDVAAGALLVTEAGGTVTNMDGSPFDLYGRAILATNGVVHAEMKEVLASTPRRYRDTVS